MRDKDIDKFLQSLREIEPSPVQMNKWRSAISRELGQAHRTYRQSKPWVQLVAAASIGFLVGAMFFGQIHSSSEENFPGNATVELVYTKY